MQATEPEVPGERFVELAEREVTLCVARGGTPNERTGRPLVVLNGTGSDLRNRPNAVEWPVADQFEILTLDHRCLGRSEQHQVDMQPTMVDFALDVLALADAEGIERFDLVGVSFGGMVAQEVAIHGGERVASMVLCCTSSGGAGGASFPLHEFYAERRDPDEMTARWDTRAATDPVIADRIRSVYMARERPSEPPAGLLRQIEARRLHDTWGRLDQVQADTLVACGEYDGVAPVENSRQLTRAIHGAEFAAFEGGHWFLAQDRSAWPTIIDFLEQ